MATYDAKGGAIEHFAPAAATRNSTSSTSESAHAPPRAVDTNGDGNSPEDVVTTVDELQASKKGRFAYFKTRDFYIVLVLG